MIDIQVTFNSNGLPDNGFIGSLRQYAKDTYVLKAFLPDGFDTGYTIGVNIERADGTLGTYAMSFVTDHWELTLSDWVTTIEGELKLSITATDVGEDIYYFKLVQANVEFSVNNGEYDPEVDVDNYNNLLSVLAGKQPLDGDLTAIANLVATNGVLTKVGANNWALSTEYFALVNGVIPAEYLPTYVDDVIEGILVNSTTFTVGGNTISPESGKIYVSTANEKVYRWSGSLYVEISSQITVGNLTGQAFDGLLGSQAFNNAATAFSWGNHANASYINASSTVITNISNNVANLQGDLGNLTNIVSNTNNLVNTINGSYLTASSTTITNLNNSVNLINSNVANLTNVVANKVDTSLLGQVNGVATLDEAGKVPTSQLPSYVDDVLEYDNLAAFPVSGDTGKIYVAKDTNITYRWSGSAYVEISASLALGNTSSTAFRGDLGKEAYDWGNHANVGYLTAESDTLDTVATRGNTTNAISVNFATIKEVSFDTTNSYGTETGKLGWNTSDGTLQFGVGNGVVLQIGEETLYQVRNQTGSNIANGTPVMASGVTAGSGRITITPAIADGSIDEIRFLGLTTQDIGNGVNGKVTHFGYVRGFDTRGTNEGEDWQEGDILYVSPTNAGKLTNIEPTAPNLKIVVAIVITRNQTSGVVFVRPTPYPHLEHLSDINISNIANGEVLAYNGTANRWENKEVVSLGLNVALSNIQNDQYLAYNNGVWVNRDLNAVTTTQITNWDSTYNIVNTTSGNWNSAFSWGNHQAVGYIVGLADSTVTSGNVALWNGTTGKLLQDGSVALQTTITNDATKLPTSSAVTTYVDGVVGDIETILDDIIG